MRERNIACRSKSVSPLASYVLNVLFKTLDVKYLFFFVMKIPLGDPHARIIDDKCLRNEIKKSLEFSKEHKLLFYCDKF